MRNRLLTLLGALTITVATFAPVALAQGEAKDIPRTADGRPDLSGTYNVATLTPLQRSEKLGDKLTLTDEEAEALAKKEAEMVAKAAEATNPDRDAPEVGGSGFAGEIDVPELDFAAGEVGGYNWFWIDRGSGAIKIDGKWRTSIITDPKNGRRPPLIPEAKKRADERKLLFQENTGKAWWIEQGIDPGPYDNPEFRPLAERCLLGFSSTGGPPMLPALYNNMKQIVQTKDHMMILIEMVHDARIVRMNAEHDPPEIRKWLGDSVGHWDGGHARGRHHQFHRSTRPGGSVEKSSRRRTLHPHRRRHVTLSVHRGGPDRLDGSLERRIRLARKRRARLRIRLSRSELLFQRNSSRRSRS